PKKGSEKPDSKSKKPSEDSKSLEDPETQQDDVSSEKPEDEAAEESDDPKQSLKSGNESSKSQPKKGSDKPDIKPSARTQPAESSLTDVFPTPPFEADPFPSRLGLPSDSNDVLAAISRVLPVIRDIGPPFVTTGSPEKVKPSMAPKTSASFNGDVYDEVDDDEDTDTVDAVAPEKQNDPGKPSHSTPPPPSDMGSCIEIILKVPTDARHVIVRTEHPQFKTQEGAPLNELVNKIAPGVYDVQLAKFDKVVFEMYDKYAIDEEPQTPNNLGKAFNYDELVPKPSNSGPSQRVPGDSVNAYLPKIDTARSRVGGVDEKMAKADREEKSAQSQRRIPDRFLAMGRRG
uniref:Uncharacterized protein n=1 Tax=Anopheles melas TaxID=34690 RepID=A0A182TGF2_9DIPT